MLKGKLVGLTAVERSDLDQFRIWRNDIQFRKFFREYRELNRDMQEKWFQKTVLDDDHTIMLAVRRLKDDELLGCCGLVYIDWIQRQAEISIYIGYDNAYIDKKGYAKESCVLLLNYAFNELGLNKVFAEIYNFDKQKKDLFKKLSFHLDGILRQNYFFDGKWWDSLVFSILSNELGNRDTKCQEKQ